MTRVLVGAITGLLVGVAFGKMIFFHPDYIILPISHKKAVSIALADRYTNKWIKRNFKISQALRRNAKLEWKEDWNTYVWQITLTEPLDKCCLSQTPARADIFIDATKGNILERVFKKSSKTPTYTSPECKNACHPSN